MLDGALPKNFVLRTDYSKKITAKDPDLSKSESHIASHNDKSFVYFKVISKVEWMNKKKSSDFTFHWSKSGPVYMLKVVHSLAFDTMLFHKSSFIFPMR